MLPSLDRTATGESGPIIAPETAAPSWLRPPFAVKRPSRRTTAPDGSFNPAWTLSGPVLGTAPCAPNTPKTASATTTPPVIVSATPVAVALKARFMRPPWSTPSTVRTDRAYASCLLRQRIRVVTVPSRSASDRLRRLGRVAKAALKHACTECGYSAGRWFGKCPGCGAFGTLVEESAGTAVGASAKPLLRLVDVEADEAERIATGVPEPDRVLGGGLVPASLVLVGGEPGVGKSTLLLSALAAVSRAGRRALLVTGEESTAQVKLRADRLGGAERGESLAEPEP